MCLFVIVFGCAPGMAACRCLPPSCAGAQHSIASVHDRNAPQCRSAVAGTRRATCVCATGASLSLVLYRMRVTTTATRQTHRSVVWWICLTRRSVVWLTFLRPCLQEEFFLAFAKFEEIVKEFDRARAIYKYALDQLPRGSAQTLYETFNKFEKQHGSRYVLLRAAARAACAPGLLFGCCCGHASAGSVVDAAPGWSTR